MAAEPTLPSLSIRPREPVLIYVLCLTAFTSVFANYILSPVLPDLSKDLGLSVSLAGQLAVVFALTAGIVGLIVGPLLDRWGRRPAMLLGTALMLVAFFGSVLAGSFLWLLLFWSVGGVGVAALRPAGLAAAGDLFPYRERSRIIGYMSSAANLSLLVGLPFGAVVTELLGWRLLFLFWSLFLLIGFFSFLRFFPTHLSMGNRSLTMGTQGFALRDYVSVLRDRSNASALLSNLLAGIFISAWITYLGAFFVQGRGLRTGEVAPVFVGLGVGSIVGGLLGGVAGARLGHKPSLILSLGILAFLYPLQTAPGVGAWEAGLITFLLSIPWGARFTNQNTLISELAPEQRGTITSLNIAMLRFGGMAGAALGGVAIDQVGYESLGWLCGVASLLALLLVVFWVQERRR